MKKEMLINVLQPEECRIAIIEDGVLEELYVERTSHESYTGNIYKGRIVNLEPAIQAAFVDFSVGRNGFLHVSDVEPQYFERTEGAHDELDPGAARARPRAEARPAPRPRPRRSPRPRRRGLSRSIRLPAGCRRPRPGWKSGLESAAGNAIETRTEAVSASAPTCRSKAGAIDPSHRRGGSAKAWSSRPIPGLEPDRPAAAVPSQPHLPFEEATPRAADRSPGPRSFSVARNPGAHLGPGHHLAERAGSRVRPGAGAGLRSRACSRPSRKSPSAGGFVRSSRSIPTCLPAGLNGRGAQRAQRAPAKSKGQSGDDTASLPHPLRPIDEWPRTGAGPAEPEIESPGGREPRRGRGRGRPSPPPGRSRPVPPVDQGRTSDSGDRTRRRTR